MNEIIEVRPYESQDKEQILDLILTIQRKEFGILITAEQQPDLSDIPFFYQHGTGNFWSAICKNTTTGKSKVVGTISLLDIGNDQAALRKMFVAKEYRGSTYGTAEKLLSALLNWYREKELKDVFLGTTSRFIAAHKFYEKNGFLEVPKEQLPDQFPIMNVDSKFYQLLD